ncbi:hypothetical protein BDR07DRAFT_1385527, partial [Suillus spraguei]
TVVLPNITSRPYAIFIHQECQGNCWSSQSVGPYVAPGQVHAKGFIFEVVYYVWKSGKADLLAGTLGRSTGWVSFEEFIIWVNEEEKDQGRELETSDPNFFQ